MIRVDAAVRDGERRAGRRGSEIRSAMLLSGLTTETSVAQGVDGRSQRREPVCQPG